MYKCPVTQIKIGGMLSKALPVQCGTRQGCPLSPFLFALVMEPLATGIRKSTTVTGIQGSINEKLALYADDLVLFLNDPGPSLREALAIFSRFIAILGLG